MNVNLMIDSVVRQTMVLIAQLATTSGGRAPLAHVAGRVFLDLVTELKSQGVGGKVIADMFGMALRTYRDRVRRFSESATTRGMTLWEAVLGYVGEHQIVSRHAILHRFRADDEAAVRAILHDLVDSGLLFKSGREHQTAYRAARSDELLPQSSVALTETAWVLLHQKGPLTIAELAVQLGVETIAAQPLVTALVNDGRARAFVAASGTETERYVVDHCVIPAGAEYGWEASLLDHYHAVVSTLVRKLQVRGDSARSSQIGGSTYHFDLFPGHPQEDEVLRLLSSVRSQLTQLRELARNYRPKDGEGYRVLFYVGQNVLQADAETVERSDFEGEEA